MARTVFKNKKKFEKSYTIFNTKKDWDMTTEHLFAMASDPSRNLVSQLIDVLQQLTNLDENNPLSEEELQQLNDDFFYCISELIIDCDIKGMDFSTAEAADKSMNSPDVDWHFMFDVLGRYVNHLFLTHRTLGKVYRKQDENGNSGNEQ